MSSQFEGGGVEKNDSPDAVYNQLKTGVGKKIEIPGSMIDMPESENVTVSIGGVVEADGSYQLKVIPESWEKENPDGKFGTKALTISLDNPREFIREFLS